MQTLPSCVFAIKGRRCSLATAGMGTRVGPTAKGAADCTGAIHDRLVRSVREWRKRRHACGVAQQFSLTAMSEPPVQCSGRCDVVRCGCPASLHPGSRRHHPIAVSVRRLRALSLAGHRRVQFLSSQLHVRGFWLARLLHLHVMHPEHIQWICFTSVYVLMVTETSPAV